MSYAALPTDYESPRWLGRGGAPFTSLPPIPEPYNGDGRTVGRLGDSGIGKPVVLVYLDRSPDGQFVALQVVGAIWPRWAGVWDAHSGSITWEPGDIVALCWALDGQHVYVIRVEPRDENDFYSHEEYIFECWTWPGKQPIRSFQTPLHTDGLAPDYMLLSPQGNLVAIRCVMDDHEIVILISLDMDHATLRPMPPPRPRWDSVHGPVFSPDGRYLVMTCGDSWTLAYDDPGNQPWAGRPGDRFRERCVVCIYDTRSGTTQEIVIEEEYNPFAWFTYLGVRNRVTDWSRELLAPRFVSPDEFVVRLPSGEERRFHVAG